MKLSSKDKELLINIWLLVVLPLVVYGLVIWNNKVTQRYLASLELTEEWKKEIKSQLNKLWESENSWEFNILNYTD